jgi:hypothetical protein
LELIDFLPDLVGSFIGAFLGFTLGIVLERKMRKETEVEEKKQIVNSLLSELSSNIVFLEKSENVRERIPPPDEIYAYLLTKSGYDSVIYSGKIHFLAHQTQRYLTWHYGGIERWNQMVVQYNSEHSFGRPASHTVRMIIEIYDALNKSIPDVKTLLEQEINGSMPHWIPEDDLLRPV